jgi:hypothetical protein
MQVLPAMSEAGRERASQRKGRLSAAVAAQHVPLDLTLLGKPRPDGSLDLPPTRADIYA